MSQPPSELSNFPEIARFIRDHARSGGEIIYLPHARRAMTEDRVNAAEIRLGLGGCAVVRRELHGSWRVTCRIRTRTGDALEVVVEIIDPVLEEQAGASAEKEKAKLL